jgi:Fibronectin type III domain/Cysteine-rich secretory protein family/Bacterial Ig-like domain (group 3)
MLAQTNYYRAMAGVPPVTFTPALNTEAQAAALIQSANNSLNHHPPSTGTGSTCWTQLGATGSAASSLSEGQGFVGPQAVDNWAEDTGDPTQQFGESLGHRRNMLDPSITTMGAGSIPATPGGSAVSAEVVLTTPTATRPPVRDNFVAWPPAGFVAYPTVYARWSFSLPNANFSHATVAMQHNGSALPVTLKCLDPDVSTGNTCGQFGEPAITWLTNVIGDGGHWPKPAADDPYTVTVSGYTVNGVAQAPTTYTTTVIDPAVSSASDTLSTAPTGPATPGAGQGSTYTVAPAADASGYQWRTTPLTPGDVVDGAENGLANWTATVSALDNPISTTEAATGTSSFHLASGTAVHGVAPPTQILTYNKTLVPGATSSVSFDSLYFSILNETARVEVSSDGGATWQPTAFAESPPWAQEDTAFTHKTVSLAAFAGQQIQLRFSLTWAGDTFAGCCGEPGGWYFDNVALANVLTAGTSVLSAITPTPSFVLNTAQQGPAAIDVRPQFTNASFGSSFGGWSPSLQVLVVGSTGLVTVTSSANPTSGIATYSATVAPTDGGGTVSFTDNGTAVATCQGLTLNGGVATCAANYANGQGGSHSIVATYSGDGTFNGSVSPALTEVVQLPSQTTGTVTASATTVQGGQPVTFTATVDPTDGGGTVAFALNDSNIIAGCEAVPLTAAGQATCTMTIAGPGGGTVSAFYSGDANFAGGILSGSPDVVVTAQTSISLTTDSNAITAGQSVTYSAVVSPANAFGYVVFLDNGSPIPAAGGPSCAQVQLSSGAASCLHTYSADGPHVISAQFIPTPPLGQPAAFNTSASDPLSETVGTLQATTTTLNASSAASVTGEQVTYTAFVSGGDGSGTVSFTDLGFPVAACQAVVLTAGQATCSPTYTDTSSHLIAAAYSGDPAGAASVSSDVPHDVTLSTPTTAPTLAVDNLGNGAATVAITTPPAPFAVRAAIPAVAPVSNVFGYNLYQGTTAGGESATPVNPSRILATATGYTVKGLTAGKKYFFVMRALNAAGAGVRSAEVSVVPATAPSAPRTLVIHSGNGSAALSWTAPSSAGGGTINGYNVYVGTAAGHESLLAANPAPLAPTARTFTVPKLVNGTKYYFIVQALNSVAAGPKSNEVSATPATAPYAPFAVIASPGAESVAVRWVKPDTRGSAITGFNVYKGTKAGGEAATPVNTKPLPATTTSLLVTGLSNGTKYFLIVRAISAAGASPRSAEVSATPAAVAPPGAPGTLTAKPGIASVTLHWTAPTATNGTKITGYNVYRGTTAGGESAVPVNSTPLPAGTTSYKVTGLHNAVRYVFTVKAINAKGPGAASNEASATPES